MSEIKSEPHLFLERIKFDDKGLVPAIIQDISDGSVLMLGYMNKKSLQITLEKGLVTFWSRSRQKFWTKGETSGYYLVVKNIYIDCDADTILVKAEPQGPTCHTGHQSCFFTEII
mgnify:CR=1 FL=1